MLQGFEILIQASPGVSENMAKVAVQRQALQQLLHHCTAQLLVSQTCPVLVSHVIYLETKQTCTQYCTLFGRSECVSASRAILFEPLYAVLTMLCCCEPDKGDVCTLLGQASPA